MDDDELLEVTPKIFRIRKRIWTAYQAAAGGRRNRDKYRWPGGGGQKAFA